MECTGRVLWCNVSVTYVLKSKLSEWSNRFWVICAYFHFLLLLRAQGTWSESHENLGAAILLYDETILEQRRWCEVKDKSLKKSRQLASHGGSTGWGCGAGNDGLIFTERLVVALIKVLVTGATKWKPPPKKEKKSKRLMSGGGLVPCST